MFFSWYVCFQILCVGLLVYIAVVLSKAAADFKVAISQQPAQNTLRLLRSGSVAAAASVRASFDQLPRQAVSAPRNAASTALLGLRSSFSCISNGWVSRRVEETEGDLEGGGIEPPVSPRSPASVTEHHVMSDAGDPEVDASADAQLLDQLSPLRMQGTSAQPSSRRVP